MLTLGTVVTGSGPHAGDIQAHRYHLDPRTISWLHADTVIALIALTFALILLIKVSENESARSLLMRRATLFLFICLAQGLIGYIQYFTGLPEALVAAHLLGADLVWLGIWNLAFTGKVLSKRI